MDLAINSSSNANGTTLRSFTPRRPRLSHDTMVTWVSVVGVEGLIVIFINLLTILTFTTKTMLKRSVYCLLHLAVADLIVGLAALPMNFHLLGCYFGFWGSIEKTFFRASATVHVFTGMLSLFSLVLVSLERMCAMVWPLHHRTARTRVYILAFLVTWLLAAAVAAIWLCQLLFFRHEVSLYVWIPALLLSVFIIAVSYALLFLTVRLQHRQRQGVLSKRTNLKEKELAVTLVIVTVTSVATMVPYAVVQIFNFKMIRIPFNVLYTAVVLEYSNSLVNPLIYIIRMREFRRALCRLITPGKCIHKQRQKESLFTKTVTRVTVANDGKISGDEQDTSHM